jgi:hypothetical protein
MPWELVRCPVIFTLHRINGGEGGILIIIAMIALTPALSPREKE